jgi:small-conductance mechanosensitive channel
MITLIILILLITIGGYLTTKRDYDLLGVVMCLIFGLWVLYHSIFYFTVSYKYGLFVEKRNAFEQTLKEARENGNEFETAAIVKEISEWNQELAEYKYKNKTLFFDQYIDDRIELLEPIK